MNTHVLLINTEISSGCPTAFVIGRTGRKYGRSIFCRGLASLGIKGISHGHVCRITQAEYAVAALDLKDASRNRQNFWLVVPIDEATPPTLPEVDAKMNWLKLKKIAKDEGVSLDGAKGNAAIVDAIMAKRGALTA